MRGFGLLPVQVTVVVPGEGVWLAVLYLNDLVGDLSYEGSVVGYEADGAAIVAEGVGEYLP